MKTTLIAASALALIAMPAHAQLLGGGGGLGGGLGGMVGGTLGAPMSMPTMPMNTVTRTASGTLDGTANTAGSQSVDRKTGHVEANRSADASVTGSTAQMLNNSAAPVAGNASGSGSASGQGNASADLIGTNALRSTAQSAVARTRSLTGAAVNRAGNAASRARSTASGLAPMASGAASGTASGSGLSAGNAGLTGSTLAAAGSAAASGEGAFAIGKGTMVLDNAGQRLGKVRSLVTDSSGRVRDVLVKTRQGVETLPASALSATGSGALQLSGSANAAGQTGASTTSSGQ